MNTEHLQQIFSHYIDKFEYVNNNEHNENYKWYIANEFHQLMDEALGAADSEFAEALMKVCKCSDNIVDSYTQPFYGLVQFAKEEPKTVRKMFLDLYSDDGGDIHVQEKLIENFFDQSNQLLDKYFPGSFLYKQNSHSVSAYLFLYDPDHHYMYKAEQSKSFADCIEYYDDWGTGDNIKLDVYYRMCDWIVDQIMESEELLATDASRFDLDAEGEMFPDEAKHLLAFDLIYCCSVYDLFDGISFDRPKTKEKQLIVENRKKAEQLLAEYEKAKADKEKLTEAYAVLDRELRPGEWLSHKKYGRGKVLSYKDFNMEVAFEKNNEVKKLGALMVFANKIATLEQEDAEAAIEEIAPWLKRKDSIERIFKFSEKELQPYTKYLE